MTRKIIMMLIVACCCNLASAGETSLGRLFTTPAERARIDQHRTTGAEIATLNGYVTNSQGRTTTWINQVSDQSAGNLQVVQRPGQAPLISVQTATGAHVRVRVGDAVDVSNNHVQTLIDAPQYVAPAKAK
ncbi:5-hydroxyisourate hydrolase-like protein (transthyretin family) [Oxalobacteraceae bacterium GrIS 1.18]